MRKAALNTSAASELPKQWANTRSRIRPATRLRKIPAATRKADCRELAGADWVVEVSVKKVSRRAESAQFLSSFRRLKIPYSKRGGSCELSECAVNLLPATALTETGSRQ